MKKRGFTLIELIGVIAILGVILAIGFPVFTKIILSNSEKAREASINEIIKVSKTWAVEHMDIIAVEVEPQYVTIKQLYNLGYITNDKLIDPVTKESWENSCVKVEVNNYTSYDYTFQDKC